LGWGFGVGVLGFGVLPQNPKTPIPNPQSPIPNKFIISKIKVINLKIKIEFK